MLSMSLSPVPLLGPEFHELVPPLSWTISLVQLSGLYIYLYTKTTIKKNGGKQKEVKLDHNFGAGLQISIHINNHN